MNVTTTRNLAAEIIDAAGMTWAPGKVAPEGGYMVSAYGAEMVIPLDYFGASDVALFMMEHGARVAGDGRAYFGAWVDGGDVYLDVSYNVQDCSEAVAMGHLERQLAIFDVAAGEVIDLR